jgi:hypothetical protein
MYKCDRIGKLKQGSVHIFFWKITVELEGPPAILYMAITNHLVSDNSLNNSAFLYLTV